MPLEKVIVAKVIATARRLGWWACKIHGNAYQVAGLPDVLCIKGGRAAWMECKQPGKDPTRIQNHRMRELISFGSPCATIRSAGDAEEFLRSVEQ